MYSISGSQSSAVDVALTLIFPDAVVERGHCMKSSRGTGTVVSWYSTVYVLARYYLELSRTGTKVHASRRVGALRAKVP